MFGCWHTWIIHVDGLGESELLLEALGHLGGWWTWHGEGDLDTVVDEPLGGCESTDHDDSGNQTSPQASEAELLGDVQGRGALGLVQFRDDCVGWVRHDGAEDTGNITSGEGDDQLFSLGALGARLGHDVSVQEFEGLFEAGELHHCVWDLTHPEWHETLVEGVDALFLHHLGESCEDFHILMIFPERKTENSPSRRVLANPGVVWILTLAASNGDKAMSAKNSAEAEAAKYNPVR